MTDEEDDICGYCGHGDPVPDEYWVCPVCDAEWVPEQPEEDFGAYEEVGRLVYEDAPDE